MEPRCCELCEPRTAESINECVEDDIEGDVLTVLMNASRMHHHDCMRALLRRQADTEVTSGLYGWTALMFACEAGDDDGYEDESSNAVTSAEILLDAGANVNAASPDGWTALLEAIDHGNEDLAMLLLEAGADVNHAPRMGDTVLYHAAVENLQDCIRELIERGANLNAATRDNCTPLIAACMHQSYDAAMQLLQAGADVNVVGEMTGTALLVAAGNVPLENISIIEELIRRGAALDELHPMNGRTALIQACVAGKGTVAMTLLEAGADPNVVARDVGSALVVAAGKSGLRVVVFEQIRRRARTDARNASQRTALIEACRVGRNNADVVLALIVASRQESGVIDLADTQGRTALWYICAKETMYPLRREVIAALVAAGADPCKPDITRQTPLSKVHPSFAVTIAATSNELVQTLRRERDQLAHVLGQSCSPFLSRQAILQRLRPPPSP